MANLEPQIVSKIATRKISSTLNNFKDHIWMIQASKLNGHNNYEYETMT